MNNRCKRCGWENPDKNKVCTKCNTPLRLEADNEYISTSDDFQSEDEDIDEGSSKKCPKCGYLVRLTAQRCPNCGSQVTNKTTKLTVPDKDYQESQNCDETISKSTHSDFEDTECIDDDIYEGTAIQDADGTTKPASKKKLVGMLVTYSQNPRGLSFPIYEGRNIIGRKTIKTSPQGDNEVSEQHCLILYRAVEKKFRFKDLQSGNGTYVNGEILDEGELKNYDVITVGSTKMIFIAIPEF